MTKKVIRRKSPTHFNLLSVKNRTFSREKLGCTKRHFITEFDCISKHLKIRNNGIFLEFCQNCLQKRQPPKNAYPFYAKKGRRSGGQSSDIINILFYVHLLCSNYGSGSNAPVVRKDANLTPSQSIPD